MTKSPYKNHPVSSIAGCILLFVILVWSSTAEASQVFEPGDKLLLRIAGIVDKVYEVDHAGYVNFELWGGMVQVSDLSTPEAANIIQKQLSRYIKFQGRQPYVSLIKKKFETEESYISVFGEVRFPGSFSYKL
ncbi:MAG: hypothetical protein GY866_23420, partial [Proteobacteria bacterium]|nr:hypothetical protein [Pseudomonadota bacterium]